MWIIKNNLIPFPGYLAMTIGPFIFTRKNSRPLDEVTINHEAIHWEQQKELLILPFFLLYVVEYLARLVMSGFNHKKAYRNISFEKEAYEHETDMTWIKNRKHYNYYV